MMAKNMRPTISLALFLIFAGAMFTAFGALYLIRSGIISADGDTAPATAILAIGDREIEVEIAHTPQERAEGLSNRNELKEGEGLFFVFPESGYHGIWMRDMRFSIDILWFNEELEVVDMKEYATPESYPEVFRPKESARYVLEVRAGFVEREGITPGASATFTGSTVRLRQ